MEQLPQGNNLKLLFVSSEFRECFVAAARAASDSSSTEVLLRCFGYVAMERISGDEETFAAQEVLDALVHLAGQVSAPLLISCGLWKAVGNIIGADDCTLSSRSIFTSRALHDCMVRSLPAATTADALKWAAYCVSACLSTDPPR